MVDHLLKYKVKIATTDYIVEIILFLKNVRRDNLIQHVLQKTWLVDKLHFEEKWSKLGHFYVIALWLNKDLTNFFLLVYKYDKIYIRLITNKLSQFNSYFHVNLQSCILKFESRGLILKLSQSSILFFSGFKNYKQ